MKNPNHQNLASLQNLKYRWGPLSTFLIVAMVASCVSVQESEDAVTTVVDLSANVSHEPATANEHGTDPVDIRDPHIARWHALTYDKIPPPPAADSYGMVGENGSFKHPIVTPGSHAMHPFEGQLDYWETQSYS